MEKIEIRKRPRLNIDHLHEDDAPFRFESKNYRRFLPFLILTTSLLVFVFIYWQAYKNTIKPIDINSIETVARDTSPIRMKPDDPGGVVFSNQDKEIYNNIKRSNQIEEFDFAEQETGSDIQAVLGKLNKEKPKQQLEAEAPKVQDEENPILEQLPVEQTQKKDEKTDPKSLESSKEQIREKAPIAKKEVNSVFDLVEESSDVSIFVFSSINKEKAKQMLNKIKPSLKGKSISLVEGKNLFRIKVSGFSSEAQAEKFCLSQKLNCRKD